jgi:long-chain fatty acid transport protein
MFRRATALARGLTLALLTIALQAPPAWAQIGPILTSQGPVDRSMGGAAVAAPLDTLGALYWNPATTSALPNSMDFGVELVRVQSRLSSSLPADAFGPGIPAVGAGTDADNGITTLPSLGLVYRPADSSLTYGLGIFAVAGFSVNYPASSTNPILTPQPPNGVGLGNVYSNLQVLQIAPTLSLQVTDRLSIGGGPTVDLATFQANPFILTAPNADGSYPSATHTHTTWGMGAQLGVYYTLDDGWRVGASLKSPQWFDAFEFNTTDSHGLPRTVTFRADLPMIPSVGVAYSGWERWLFAADFRYVDFGNADGFRQSGFDTTGTLRGLGWESVFAMSLGAQYELNDCVSLRLGYSFNQNPISNSEASANVASPTILENTVYVGASFKLSETLTVSLAYAHAFQNSVEGPLVTPLGQVPGSSVTSTVSADTFLFGATVHY